jgi:hypothetical protein
MEMVQTGPLLTAAAAALANLGTGAPQNTYTNLQYNFWFNVMPIAITMALANGNFDRARQLWPG